MSFKNFGLGNWITLYLLTTKQFVRKYPSLMYDYIYIDAGHLYKEVVFDYKALWPRLAKGGLMSFHDVSIKEKQAEGNYGVWKLWKSISYKHSIIFEHPATGLGVIQKK
jgi:predicted O-methyltransferase YrrM